MILDGVIGAAREVACDGGPAIPEPGVSPDDGLVLLGSEGTGVNLGRKLVAPPEPARFSGATRNGSADEAPVDRTVNLNLSLQNLIFLGAPGTFPLSRNSSGRSSHGRREIRRRRSFLLSGGFGL